MKNKSDVIDSKVKGNVMGNILNTDILDLMFK